MRVHFYFDIILLKTGPDVLSVGLATHYCDYARLGDLEAALLTCTNTLNVVTTLSKFCQNNEENASKQQLENLLQQVKKCFSGNRIEDIFENLDKANTDWSRKQLKVYVFSFLVGLNNKIPFKLDSICCISIKP